MGQNTERRQDSDNARAVRCRVDPTGDPVESAFGELRDRHWSEPERHRAFVALATLLGRLPDAAARYRSATSNPALADEARKGLDAVLAAAVAQIDAAPRTARDEVRRRAGLFVPIAALGLMLALAYLAATLTQRRELVSAPAVALEIAFVALLPWRRLLR
jgi:hypothetical protein